MFPTQPLFLHSPQFLYALLSGNAPFYRLFIFRPVTCITANSASKSILRVAVDEIMQNSPKNVFYWPSYEIVKDFHVDSYMDDGRHINQEIVKQIMRLFHKYYLYKDQ